MATPTLRERLGPPEKTLYLVDISSFIFRAFFAIRSLTSKSGEPTNAVYGVAAMLQRLIGDAAPRNLVIVYDSKEPSNRKQVYAEYKANRSAPPDDLIPQFDRIEQLIQCMGIHSYRKSGIEADDLIATLARKWNAQAGDHRVVVVTGDKDLMQLVDERTRVWDTMKNEIFEAPEVEAKFGVRPTQIRDYLALVGDSSDNIPGVPSIGPKSAVGLLVEHGDLDSVLEAAKNGRIAGKKGEVLVSHRDDAKLSQRLATLDEAIELELDPRYVAYEFAVSDPCLQLLRELDLHSIATKWQQLAGASPADLEVVRAEAQPGGPGARPAAEPAAPQPREAAGPSLRAGPDTFRTVNTAEALDELVRGIERSKEFGFDLETTSLNPRVAEIVGVAICHDRAFGCYIPVGHRGTDVPQLGLKPVLERLRPYLEDPRYKKIGQNLKYDWSVLIQNGIRPDGIGADTMIAAYVLEPENRHNLEALAASHLGYAVTTYEQVCGKGKDQLCFDQVPIDQATRYSAEDAWVAVHLWDRLRLKLEEERLMEIFARVDLPLVDVLCRMELVGVCIDTDWLARLSREFEKDLRRIEERVAAFTKGPVNLGSPKQLAQLLFEELKLPPQGKTKTGFSTDASVLQALSPLHEVPRLLLEYREVSKLKGTYVDTLPGMRDPRTGRIHAGFHQTVAATGRLSSSDPNLQNIPIRTERGRKIRRAFIPSSGNVLVSADYSQIELRLLAHMSGDVELVRSFQKDEDVHRRTASEIFEIDASRVDDRQRGIAKAINFGLMYGKTAFGLAQELRIPQREAKEIIARYFERYSGVKRYLDQSVLDAKEKGWTQTLLGRKRYLPDITSRNPAVRQNAERMAMNTPIQGTAADLMKIAMVELDERLARVKLESKLIVQVHDEFVLDCPRRESETVRKLVTEVMEGAMKLTVPLRVNSAVGENWMDL
jgi:DNA polymerase-1